MLKKFFCLMNAILLFFVLIGCSANKEGNKVTVDVFNIKTETAEQMDELVKDFEKTHNNIKINMTTVGGGSDSTAALQAKFSSGDEPSIFMLGGLSDTQTWEDKLFDLSDTDLAKNAIDGTLEGATLNDKVLGVPMNIEGYGWLVNKEIFKKAGVSVDDIKTFSDFKNAVESIDKKKDDLGLEGVFAFSGGETWVSSQYSSYFIGPEFNNSLAETYNAKELSFKYADIMKNYTDLAVKYNAKPFESMDYSTSVEELFANDKVAIIHQGNWIVPTLNSMDEEFAKNKLAIVPMFVDGDAAKIVAGPSWYWGINKDQTEEEIDASIEFLNWMYSDEKSMKSIIEDFEFIPAYSNFSSNDMNDPVSKQIYNYVSEGQAIPWVHNSYPDGFGQNSIGVQLQSYSAGKITWEEFKENIITKWNEDRK